MKRETKYLPGLKIEELTLDVPLHAAEPDGRQIKVFARIITGREGEKKPYLVFFQGGPGSEDPRPSLEPTLNPGWLRRALDDFQVVMLDQRGTGRSTPVSARPDVGPLAGMSPSQQCEYLTHLRADEIVNDAEAVRQALGIEQWYTLGQSFGGFTTVRYLSAHPESLAGCIVTGGLTAVGHTVDEVYATTWDIMVRKSQRYYRYFPADRDKVRRVAELCAAGRVRLPNGDVVTPQRWRTVGITIGMQGGGLKLHNLLDFDPLSDVFAHDLQACLPFGGRNPIYSILHESSYADGMATKWAAERTMPAAVRDDPTLLGGEHIYRALFAESTEHQPLQAAADLVASHEWNQLYAPSALARAQVPVAAVAYYNDAYVPLKYALELEELLPDCRLWVTNEYEHNGLRQDERVLNHLIDLLRGRVLQ